MRPPRRSSSLCLSSAPLCRYHRAYLMNLNELPRRVRTSIGYRTIRQRDAAFRRLLPLTFPAARGRRFRASLEGAHSEWTIIHSGAADAQTASPELVGLCLEAASLARKVDVGFVARRATGEERDNASRWPGEHYRLLPALVEVWKARRVTEIGTSTGLSALTFQRAVPVEHVITFDIHPWTYYPGTALREDDFDGSLEQRLADLSKPTAFAANLDAIADSDLLFIDGPKDGAFEPKFFDLLWRHPPTRRQLLVIDDVRVITMTELWRKFPIAKFDATSFGHWSGTGLAIREPGLQ